MHFHHRGSTQFRHGPALFGAPFDGIHPAKRRHALGDDGESMLEIGRVFESALRTNSEELKKAAVSSVRRLGPDATIRELLDSDAAAGIRKLSLGELCEAAGLGLSIGVGAPLTRTIVAAAPSAISNEERMYRMLLDVLSDEPPMTIGQIAKAMQMEADVLKPFVAWMRDMGKIESIGRARATRYRLI
jgi:hypothetical protein